MRSLAQPLVLAILVIALACSKAKRSEPSAAGGGAPFETGALHDAPQPPPAAGAFDDANQLETGADPDAVAYQQTVASMMRAEMPARARAPSSTASGPPPRARRPACASPPPARSRTRR